MHRTLLPLAPLLLGTLLTAAGARAPQAGASLTLHREPALSPAVQATLRALPPGVQTALLVQDMSSGRVLEARTPDRPMIPASVVKLVTAAAVLADRGGADGFWSSELSVPAAQVGSAAVTSLTLRGSGDPGLRASGGGYSLRALAVQAHAHGLRRARAVRLDDAGLDPAGWSGSALDLPMSALRLAEWHDRPPLSAAQARELLGAALIAELRRAGILVDSERIGQAPRPVPYRPPPRRDERGQPLPPDPLVPLAQRPEQGIASVRSAGILPVLAATLRPSDNLRAEELLATLARRPGGGGTRAGALALERTFLRRAGLDLQGVVLADGSGLGRDNRLTARALTGLLRVLYNLPYPTPGPAGLPGELYRARRNTFAELLPQAGTGEDVPHHDGRGGTLALRLRGSGLDVRAKTGTLPGVSALAGYLTPRGGRVLGFAILLNGPEDSDILAFRNVQDDLLRAVAAAH